MSPMNTGRTRVARTFRLAVAATQAVWPILPVTTSTGVCCTRKASIKRGSGAIARASITTTAIGEEHYLLIHLQSLWAENLEQPPLGLGVVRLDKAEGLV